MAFSSRRSSLILPQLPHRGVVHVRALGVAELCGPLGLETARIEVHRPYFNVHAHSTDVIPRYTACLSRTSSRPMGREAPRPSSCSWRRRCRRPAPAMSSFSRPTARAGSRVNWRDRASRSSTSTWTGRCRRRARGRCTRRFGGIGSRSLTATSSPWRCTAPGLRGATGFRTSSPCTADATTPAAFGAVSRCEPQWR